MITPPVLPLPGRVLYCLKQPETGHLPFFVEGKLWRHHTCRASTPYFSPPSVASSKPEMSFAPTIHFALSPSPLTAFPDQPCEARVPFVSLLKRYKMCLDIFFQSSSRPLPHINCVIRTLKLAVYDVLEISPLPTLSFPFPPTRSVLILFFHWSTSAKWVFAQTFWFLGRSRLHWLHNRERKRDPFSNSSFFYYRFLTEPPIFDTVAQYDFIEPIGCFK